MGNFLRSKDWWDLIEPGIPQYDRTVILTGPQRTELADIKLKDLKAKNYLFASIDKSILKTIAKKDTAKDIWDAMKTKYQGNKRVKSAQLQRLRREFEILEMKEGETVREYFSRVMVVANDMRNLGEIIADSKIVEKILRTLVERFTYVVCAIEESNDISSLSVDELQSRLQVHEQNLVKHTRGDDQALEVESGRGKEGGSSGGRGGRGRGGGGRGFDKSKVECFHCHRYGHFKNECPSWEGAANYAEYEEDVLLMALVEDAEEDEETTWYLDSGCSNHMCGNKDWFLELDNNFRHNVKLGDNRRMVVEGKGNLRLEINGINQVISSVYYVPGLKNNLFSVGQLQQKGLRITIDDDVCEVWHKQQQRVIMQSNMTKNRMFVVMGRVKGASDEMEEKMLQSTVDSVESDWHGRFGHLNHNSLKMLIEKKMVNGISKFNTKEGVCEVCMKGKQNRTNIPKQSSWRPSRGLELVHSDICGPISPVSESGKRYYITFIDDFSRKCWTVLLSEKSEAFKAFKEFKIAAEKEIGQQLACLRTDRGGEFNSKEFEVFCAENGVKRQLTAAYTPQQNGVAERKNRSIMNMVRCMLFGMKVPLRFWPEAVQYAVHILNRSPTAILGDVTPVEKWSNHKPSVEHLRVFGSIAYAMIPYEKRVKLDEKSVSCVMFGVSKESKAYRLYNPRTKKIIICKDEKFDEKKSWNWEEKTENEEFMVEFDEEEEKKDTVETVQGNNREEEEEQNDTAADENLQPKTNPPETEEETEEEIEGVRKSGRQTHNPGWMKDYVIGKGKGRGTNTAAATGFLVTEVEDDILVMFVGDEDPETFEDAVKLEEWRKAMEAEIDSIVENKTWELVELPEGAKVI